ncbi:MAG: hypothetical protein H0U28_08020 [Nocardioidaceae bacterium]|nr:hypothetical protein [Nocardioidaceae bacterium]
MTEPPGSGAPGDHPPGWGQPGYGPAGHEPQSPKTGLVVTAIAAVALLLVGGAVAVLLLQRSDDAACAASSATGCTEPTDTGEPTETTQTGEPTETTGGSAAAYCLDMESFQQQYANLDFTALDDEGLDQLIAGLEALKPNAPAEVEAELNTYVGGLKELQDLLADLDISLDQLYDPLVLQQKAQEWTVAENQRLQRLSGRLISEEFQSSGRALDDDYRERC